MSMGWGEAHGYTQRCAYCGTRTDSTFCSTRCELDELAAAEAEKDTLIDDVVPYGEQNNEPSGSYADHKHERAQADREEIAYRLAKEV